MLALKVCGGRAVDLDFAVRRFRRGARTKFCFIDVVGDSMLGDGIRNGDRLSARLTNEFREGRISVFGTPYGLTLKRGFRGDDETVILRSSNPAYRDQVWSAAEVVVLAVVDQQALNFMWN
jgi:SOS-response transcriptional repressor LexA